jgi:hypothetical protein
MSPTCLHLHPHLHPLFFGVQVRWAVGGRRNERHWEGKGIVVTSHRTSPALPYGGPYLPFVSMLSMLHPAVVRPQVLFSNGDIFDGQLKDDRLHYGLYVFADEGRGRYQGHFDSKSRADDKDGIQYLGDGCVYRGQFTHGYITGLGVVRASTQSGVCPCLCTPRCRPLACQLEPPASFAARPTPPCTTNTRAPPPLPPPQPRALSPMCRNGTPCLSWMAMCTRAPS